MLESFAVEPGGGFLYDVATASAITYPLPYRLLGLHDDGQVELPVCWYALDALDPGGLIEISTHWDHQTKRVKIDFSDNGMGIDPSDRDKLFLPHFTTKKRGTGLGLAIVTRIINDHNGVIQVRANEPKGTIFTLEFPDPSSTTYVGPSKTAQHS